MIDQSASYGLLIEVEVRGTLTAGVAEERGAIAVRIREAALGGVACCMSGAALKVSPSILKLDGPGASDFCLAAAAEGPSVE